MIKWTNVRTMSNYPFVAYRSKKGEGDIIILREPNDLDYSKHKSLTNNIEECMEHIASFDGYYKLSTQTKFYQWVENEGLFELKVIWTKKLIKSWPPIAATDVKWEFITKDLKHFEVLYCD